MIDLLKESLQKQFGAAIDMLDNSLRACPAEHMAAQKRFFFITYHTLAFLEYYLTSAPHKFSASLPFTLATPDTVLDKDAVDDVIPDRMYSKEELLGYLQLCRTKCYLVIDGLTEETVATRWISDPEDGSMNYSILEILLYNMRHVQHHAAQLNMLLRQQLDTAPSWVARAGER